jgi:hypothetical protein
MCYIQTRNRCQYNAEHVLCISVSKTKNTHSEHVTFIACPLQQCLHKSARMLSCKYSVSYFDGYFAPAVKLLYRVEIIVGPHIFSDYEPHGLF